MVRKRSRVADYAVYLLVRVVVAVVQAMSWRYALGLARGLARLAYRIDRRHRLLAADNIRHAFPERDESAVDHLVREHYLHLATMLVEMIRLPRVIRPNNIYQYMHHADRGDLDVVRSWVATG